jgi:hypothetical protein
MALLWLILGRSHMTRLPRFVLFGLTALIASSAMAEVDRSPRPGGVYRLKPGLFVASGARCQDPANAALRRYDGKGISTAHTRACLARVLSKRRSGYGFRYSVTQSCIDAGSGPGKRFTERQTIDVPDALTFSMPAKGGTTYRYCPLDQLPPELRSAAPASHP